MDISYETTTYGGIDQRWIGGDHGFDLAESATVDLNDAAVKGVIDQYGVLKGGTLLARKDGTDLLTLWAEGAPLFGANTRDVNTRAANGTTFPKVAVGVLRHGRIHQQFLPVPAQRTVTTADAAGTELIFD
jgi:hypothetical protein